MRFLGVVEGKELYAKWNEEYSQVRYILDGNEIAVLDPNKMQIDDKIVYKNETIENRISNEAKDTIEKMARNVNLSELKQDERNYNEQEKEKISKAIDVKKEKIKSITEVNLKEDVEQEKNNSDNNEKELATKKDIKIKQELKMDTMATSTKTIGAVLKRAGKMPNIEGKKFTKLGIVESDRAKDIDQNAKTNTTRFSFIAIANDGTVVPINLEQDHQEGDNPREISHRINADGRVEQDDVNSRYKIGNNGETISIKFSNGPGNIEVGYSAHKTIGGDEIEGNVSIDHQLETSTVYWRPRKDSRDQEYTDGYRGTEEKAREVTSESKHEEELERGKKGIADEKEDKYKDADGDEKTKDSNHQFDLIERARKLRRENLDVEETFTEEEVIEMLEKAHDEGKEMDKVEEEIKEDAERLPSRGRI